MLKRAVVSIALGVVAIMAVMGIVDPNGDIFGGGRQIRIVVPIDHDPPGSDRLHLNDESVTLENTGEEPLDLSGWMLRNKNLVTYTIPEGFTLAPNARVTIHTGCGDDTAADLYWCSLRPMWGDQTDTATLLTDRGRKVTFYSYQDVCVPCNEGKDE